MSLLDVFVFSPTFKNVTVMFPTGAGVEVRLAEGTMTTTVLLPEEFKDSTMGLLGKMNGDAKDDLVTSDGQLVLNQSNPEDLFNFGGSCKKLFSWKLHIMCCFRSMFYLLLWNCSFIKTYACNFYWFITSNAISTFLQHFSYVLQGRYPMSHPCSHMTQSIFWTHISMLPGMTLVLFQCFLSLIIQMIPWPIRQLWYALERALCTAGMRRTDYFCYCLQNYRTIEYRLPTTTTTTFFHIFPVSKHNLAHYNKRSFPNLLSLPLHCRYDILVARSLRLGNATRVSYQSHISLVEDLEPGGCTVRYCW